jgi:hypothetical protein
MARNKIPGKIGNYTGLGPNLGDVIIGKHNVGLEFAPWEFAYIPGYKIYINDTSYVSADFTQTLENSGTIAMGASGTTFTTAGSAGNSVNDQLLKAVVPTTNKRFGMYCRAAVSDVTNGFVLGFHETDSDYFSGEPVQQAVFYSPKASGTVFGVTASGSTSSSTSSLFTASNNIVYDFSILVDKVNNLVQFATKAASATTWNVTTKTTNLPTAAVRLTRNLENNAAVSGTMTIYKCIFWAEEEV